MIKCNMCDNAKYKINTEKGGYHYCSITRRKIKNTQGVLSCRYCPKDEFCKRVISAELEQIVSLKDIPNTLLEYIKFSLEPNGYIWESYIGGMVLKHIWPSDIKQGRKGNDCVRWFKTLKSAKNNFINDYRPNW